MAPTGNSRDRRSGCHKRSRAAVFTVPALPILIWLGFLPLLLALLLVIPATSAKAANCDLSALRKLVDDTPAGTWIELRGTQMRQILLRRDDPAMGYGIWGATGPEAVVKSWNGAAFNGCEWYFAAGGHMNYGGNEVYVFRMAAQRWERLTDPTPYLPASKTTPCAGTTDINKPVPGHVYDGIVFSDRTQTLFIWGASIYCDEWHTLAGAAGDNPASGRREVWEFNPDTRGWRWHGPSPEDWHFPSTAIDPATGNILYCRVRRCREFDPVATTYDRLSPEPAFEGTLTWGPAALDTHRRQLVVLSRDRFMAATVDGPSLGPLRIVRTTKELGDLDTYGLAYDPTRDVMALWRGDAGLAVLDPENWRVHRVKTVDSTAPTRATRGVYSRWEYVPALDAFMGMDNVDEGFWLIRLPFSHKIDK